MKTDSARAQIPLPERIPSGKEYYERSLTVALLRARESTMRRFKKYADGADLSLPQWRVLRALEIVLLTGQSKVDLEGSSTPPYRMLLIALSRPRSDLHRRIDARVDEMFAQGLVAETQRLLAAGYDPALPAMTSLGYREVIAYLAGRMTLGEAAARIKTETHRFVRHQDTWFRKLGNLHWFDLTRQDEGEIVGFVMDWLASCT